MEFYKVYFSSMQIKNHYILKLKIKTIKMLTEFVKQILM